MLVIESIDAIRSNDLPYVGSALILFAKMLDLNLKSLLRLQFFYYIFSYFKVSIHLSLLIYQFSMNHFGPVNYWSRTSNVLILNRNMRLVEVSPCRRNRYYWSSLWCYNFWNKLLINIKRLGNANWPILQRTILLMIN